MAKKYITVTCPYCENTVTIDKSGFDDCPVCGNEIERNYLSKEEKVSEAV